MRFPFREKLNEAPVLKTVLYSLNFFRALPLLEDLIMVVTRLPVDFQREELKGTNGPDTTVTY